MKLHLDNEADALYLRLNEAPVADSEQVARDVVLDFDAQGEVVGVEMLHVSRRSPSLDLERLIVERSGPTPIAVRDPQAAYGGTTPREDEP